jgi:hypothetical protein
MTSIDRLALFSAALLSLQAMSQSAAADTRVHVWDNDFVFEQPFTPDWGFQCSGPVYHGILNGHEDLWLWFRDSDPLWSHGRYVLQGVDYFSTAPNMSGEVVSGPARLTIHLSNHVAGPPESWEELLTGIYWNVHAPGYGSIFHETQGIRRTAEPTPGGTIFTVIRQAVAHHAFDVEELCQSLGYELLP